MGKPTSGAMAMAATVVFVKRGSRGRQYSRVFGLALLISHWGCAARDFEVSVQRFDSAGTSIVLNAQPDEPLDWSAQEVLRLGGADSGPESFTQINAAGLATDRDGRIYVLDRSTARLHVFNREGQHVWSQGRIGPGPGELQSPTALAVVGDTVHIVDFRKRSFVRFDREGALQTELRLPLDLNEDSRATFVAPNTIVAAGTVQDASTNHRQDIGEQTDRTLKWN